MKKRKFIFLSKTFNHGLPKALVGLVLLFSLSSFQGHKEMSEPTIKALFIYNFTKYVEWSGEKNASYFVIGIYGTTDITSELKLICANKKIKNRDIEIRELNETGEMEECDILFISKNQTGQLKKITEHTAGKEVLIVTEEKGMASQGAGINIIEKDDKFRFELNENTVREAGLKISTQLLSLSILVKNSN